MSTISREKDTPAVAGGRCPECGNPMVEDRDHVACPMCGHDAGLAVESLLSERGETVRELARRLTLPLPDAIEEMLREGGA